MAVDDQVDRAAHFFLVVIVYTIGFVGGFVRVVRHPLMLGFLLAFWAAPVMSPGRLLFAGVITVGSLRDPHGGVDARRGARRAVQRLSPACPCTPAAIPLVDLIGRRKGFPR